MAPNRQQARRIAHGLGWFSIGLGLAELLAARSLSRAVGLPGRADLVRAYGARELVTGVGLLRARDPAPWLWARVAGDALDIATLVRGTEGPARAGAAVALAAVAGVTALDVVCAQRLSDAPRAAGRDYGGRSGFPLPAQEMRGAARLDFQPPADFRTPEALAPWTQPA